MLLGLQIFALLCVKPLLNSDNWEQAENEEDRERRALDQEIKPDSDPHGELDIVHV